MAEPFLSEIRIMSFGFPPKGWATCDGQLLPINQNQALFSLLGTTYGGDGRVNFGLPNLQGRTPIHVGNGHTLGERAGEQTHTLAIGELPAHTHTPQGTSTSANTVAVPTANVLAGAANLYTGANNLVPLVAGSVSSFGSSQAHPNMQPYLTLNFSIALQGIFPSQS
jgi:microcystin-dependent protein